MRNRSSPLTHFSPECFHKVCRNIETKKRDEFPVHTHTYDDGVYKCIEIICFLLLLLIFFLSFHFSSRLVFPCMSNTTKKCDQKCSRILSFDWILEFITTHTTSAFFRQNIKYVSHFYRIHANLSTQIVSTTFISSFVLKSLLSNLHIYIASVCWIGLVLQSVPIHQFRFKEIVLKVGERVAKKNERETEESLKNKYGFFGSSISSFLYYKYKHSPNLSRSISVRMRRKKNRKIKIKNKLCANETVAQTLS